MEPYNDQYHINTWIVGTKLMYRYYVVMEERKDVVLDGNTYNFRQVALAETHYEDDYFPEEDEVADERPPVNAGDKILGLSQGSFAAFSFIVILLIGGCVFVCLQKRKQS